MQESRPFFGRIRPFRSKFERLLASARTKAARARLVPDRGPIRLRELTGFGANPGNLRMFSYAPADLPPNAPLVIALHGCTQTSDEYDHGTGWSSLADSLGFAVVYPQQQPANNPKNCFSGFCRATSRAATARRFRSRRWSSTPLRHLLPTAAKYSSPASRPAAPWLLLCLQHIRRFLPAAPSLRDCPMGARATFNKHSRPCSRSRDMPRRRLAIACGQHPDIAGHGRKSRYGMAPAIRS